MDGYKVKKVILCTGLAVTALFYIYVLYNEWKQVNTLSKSRWYLKKAVLMKETGLLDEALSEGKRGLSFSVIEPKIYVLLGEIYEKQGDMMKAMENIEEALNFFPADIMLNIKILKLYQNMGLEWKVKARWNKIEKFKSEWAKEMTASGFKAIKYRRIETAIQFFISALFFNPSLSEAYYGLAISYAMAGKLQDALATVERGLSLKPDDRDLLRLRERIIEKLKE